ncbi:hypothetical protein NQ317_018916 [Molorchus minor]|uniref:C2H2-type domain-containing protein n=1 Tax=Molorchus minor TaxID=1323400 RepID=A0ABQ9JLB0_9CUCU|nr:hypothetical protein NQ317_018916 [Molorchus minor]
MKIENSSGGDSIWTNNVELLTHEECLPVIGNCQISSILQNLEPPDPETAPQNMDVIILPPSDELKLPTMENYSLQNNYIILRENGIKNDKIKVVNNSEDIPGTQKTKKENFEDMLYFVCNLCPFLCTKNTKITEHLENAHKNKTVIKLPELKCPACANIFYHRMSLRSHLIHDHGVGNSDLNQIIQAVIYYSNVDKSKQAKNKHEKQNKVKKDPELHTLKSALSSEKIINEEEISNGGDNFDDVVGNCAEMSQQKQESKTVPLPQMDVSQNRSEKLFNSLMKQPDPVIKYLDSKKLNKCVMPNCKVRLQDLDKLNYHINCHTDCGFKCLECDGKFSFWKPLISHLWRLHKIDMDLYSCNECDYKTFSLAKLNNIHKLIHGDVRGFSCDICNKAFKNSKQLRNHKMTHRSKTEKLMHICDVCLRCFTDRRQLKVHMDVVHKKIRPYLCNYCGYKGSSRSSLKMHIRQHTGEKPFSCDTCSYTTSDHNSLRRHKLRHTGQKPYKCSYCSYACIQSSTYKTHLKTKHPGMEKDLMFTCHECQFRSVNKDMFSSHMITVHKMKPQFES